MTSKKVDTNATTNDKNEGVDTSIPSRSERAALQTDKDYQPATTGAVLDPNDGRLKENRDKGVTLGTTTHSATASHVGRSGDGGTQV